MKQSEINFCVMWRECSTGNDAASRAVSSWVIPRRHSEGVGCGVWEDDRLMHRETLDEPWHITPRGADLVASYEAALGQGLDIKADDAPKTSGRIDCDPDGRERVGRYDDCAFCVGDACNRCGWDLRMGNTRGCDCDVVDRHEPRRAAREPDLVDCPDCDDGTIGIPVEYAESGGVLRVWPATCPRCNGAGQVEGLADVGRPIEGLGQALDDAKRMVAGADVWLDWSEWGEDRLASLVGKTIEARLQGGPHEQLIGSEVTGFGSWDHGLLIKTEAWVLSNNDWEIRIVSRATDPRSLEWRQLTREVADGLVGKTLEARRNKNPTIYRHDRVGTLELDGHWWVRGIA